MEVRHATAISGGSEQAARCDARQWDQRGGFGAGVGGERQHYAALVVGSPGHARASGAGPLGDPRLSDAEADDLAIPQLPPRQRKRLIQYIVRWSIDGLHWAEMRLDDPDEAQCAADSYRVTLGKRAQVRIHRAWEVV